jgi:hypothetical protein
LAEVDDVLSEFFCEFEDGDVLFGEEEDVWVWDVEEGHVADVVEDLVEADVLVGEFLALALATDAPCLDVPDGDGHLFLLQLHPRLLEDALQQRGLPPPDALPDAVVADEFLQLALLLVLHEVVGEGEHHQHLRVVGVVFIIALRQGGSTTSRKTFRHLRMLALFYSLSWNSLFILYF